ncbi:MAG: hypothetical protein OXG44_09180 [Gammaproteobacteria bacterium]|nr:hypothetical protein [Gammaproteobacteria bacterium]
MTTHTTKVTVGQLAEGDIIRMNSRAPKRRVWMLGTQGIHATLGTEALDGTARSILDTTTAKRVLREAQ